MMSSVFYILISVDLIRKPSSLAKIGWIVLILLFKLNNANTDCFGKVIGYKIQETYTRFVRKSLSLFLPFLILLQVSPVLAFSRTSSLVSITGIKIVNIDTSFLDLFFGTFGKIMTFAPLVEVSDLGDIFFFFFKNDVGICSKKVIAATLFLSLASKTSLVLLIVFVSLALVGGLLFTRHISREKLSKLMLSGILTHLFC